MRITCLLLIAVVLVPLVPVIGRARVPHVMRWWYGRVLRALDIHVHVRGRVPDQAALIVANHSTWLDIVVLGHVFDAVFISKAEVRRWPVIGTYARAGGTLFLVRGASRTDEIRSRIRGRLAEGRSVVLFPEGTTSASLCPARFHARLFSAAQDDAHPVLPTALRYSDTDTPAGCHHPLVPWVDSPLSSNFMQVLGLRRLRVDVDICPAIDSRGHGRRSLARASRDAISSKLQPAGHTAAACARGPDTDD